MKHTAYLLMFVFLALGCSGAGSIGGSESADSSPPDQPAERPSVAALEKRRLALLEDQASLEVIHKQIEQLSQARANLPGAVEALRQAVPPLQQEHDALAADQQAIPQALPGLRAAQQTLNDRKAAEEGQNAPWRTARARYP